MVEISDREFSAIQKFMFGATGIKLAPNKKSLVCGRLDKRLRHHRLDSYGEYLALLEDGKDANEAQAAIDLLTTNETYFFREAKHFELLRQLASEAAQARRGLRVWSAACSSGEEVYSIAMVLSECMGPDGWELIGSDISSRMLQRARIGHYPMERAQHVPPEYLRRYCLRGNGKEQGTLLIQRSLRERVNFYSINLDQALPAMGNFDLIFLRNVMIYFQTDTKQAVVRRLESVLRPGGQLLIGHSETLNDIDTGLRSRAPSVYVKP